jgi:hypothetical protein
VSTRLAFEREFGSIEVSESTGEFGVEHQSVARTTGSFEEFGSTVVSERGRPIEKRAFELSKEIGRKWKFPSVFVYSAFDTFAAFVQKVA